ncbi:MAG: hypothetical protein KJO94_08515 [Eudoraea sp.]|nr:hypothetical protein [Eudoraea sp.]
MRKHNIQMTPGFVFKRVTRLMLCITVFFTSVASAQEKIGGLALYTVREDMRKNPVETLEKVAQTGYSYIEAAGYQNGKFYGMVPSAFNSQLKKLGLQPISTHQGSVTLENADAMIADVKAAGFKYFVVPVPPMGMFKYNRETNKMGMEGTVGDLADILETLGKKCHEA